MQEVWQATNKYMEYVLALAQNQTMSAAAEAVFISQPAMSHFIHSLEEKMGFKLFNRVGNRYIPTYEGDRYIYHARRILSEETQLYSELADIKKRGKGQIRFTLPTLRSAYILPHLIATYQKDHPNVDLMVREVHSQNLERVLLSGDVDFAIMNTDVKNPDIVCDFVCHDEVLLVLPDRHPLANRGVPVSKKKYPTIDLSLLKDERFILQPPDQRTRKTADDILKKAGIVPSILLETRSIEAALGLVSNGVGVCFAPETYVQKAHDSGNLLCFSLNQPETVYNLSIAYLRRSYFPQYFEDFIRIAKEAMSS